ncbi:hypothetical protein B6I21_03550 [candidate division KSB1 bacterium 4572_119]|nr:MAG: hypothetical protein B6I21_03550 [candidate division KSB1 bacterium 4572_119]
MLLLLNHQLPVIVPSMNHRLIGNALSKLSGREGRTGEKQNGSLNSKFLVIVLEKKSELGNAFFSLSGSII